MLAGKNNEEKIWNYLKGAGLNDFGTAGLMGNLYAESGLIPNNVENLYEKRLGVTDASYTAAVDSGKYQFFATDKAGYGLAQWTYCSRKAELLDYAQCCRKSIGDLEMQLDFLMKELREGYKAVLAVLKTAGSVRAASDAVLLKFERPADQSEAAQARRAAFGQKYYDKYAAGSAAGSGGKTMTEQEQRQKIVSIAQSYIGCKESDGSHRKIIDLYNSHKPLARGYAVKYTDAWCSTFASAVAIAAGMTDIIPTECGCGKHIELFKKLGSWQENDAYVPKPGDYIFYDWQDSGVGDCTGSADHVGIVEKVSGTSITVIEGNYSDSVKRRTISVNGRYIRGYGVPKYGGKEATGGGNAADAAPAKGGGCKVGDIVTFTGERHYTSANSTVGKPCKPGKAKVTQVYQPLVSRHPYHLVAVSGGGSTVYGWVDAADIKTEAAALAVGDQVTMDKAATVYGTTRKFSLWVYSAKLYVRAISGDRISVSTLKSGAITGNVDKKYLTTRRKKNPAEPICKDRKTACSRRKKIWTASWRPLRKKKNPLHRSTPLWKRNRRRFKPLSRARRRCWKKSPALPRMRPKHTSLSRWRAK